MQFADLRARMLTTASLLCAMVLLCQPARSDEPTEVSLLRLEQSAMVRTNLPDPGSQDVALLIDGDATTSVVARASTTIPTQIVFGFAEQTVSPERLVLHWAPSDDKGPEPPAVELLVSSLSPHTGFQSLRTARLERKTEPQEFAFVPTGAKWVLLRISPAVGADQWSLAEINLVGRVGPPATRYAFDESPAKAFNVLAQLKKMISVELANDEASLFADAKDGQLDRWSFAEAALIASGVTDRNKRAALLERIDQYEAQARRESGRATTPFEKGEQLLAFLHAKPLAGGYVAEQTDLTTLIETSTYNCVSSATIYNILGRRLGLDVRAVEVPDHAFSILYDGAGHADVEVTTDQGFNPSRDPRALQEFSQKTGFRYIPDRHPERRREIRETGLVSIIYYNHGVMHSEKQEYGEALLRYFCALSLDPEFDSAVKNVLATLANWGIELANKKHFDNALTVVNTGLVLAPKDATLLNNRQAIWHSRVAEAMDAGNNAGALSLLREAHQQVPDGNFPAMQSWVFLRPAEQLVKTSRWEEALAVAASGVSQVDDEARKELADWRQSLFLRWSSTHVGERQFSEAMEVLDRGLALWPQEPSLTSYMAYVVQEWTQEALRQEGPEGAETLLSRLLEQHHVIASLADVASSYTIRLVNDLRQQKKFAEALAATQRCRSFVPSDEVALTLTRSVYDSWASGFSTTGNWEEALAIYEKALQQLPDDAHLSSNLRATWAQWAQSHMQLRQWSQAAEVYGKAMVKLPSARFDRNLGFITQEWLKDIEVSAGADGVEQTIALLSKQFGNIEGIQSSAINHFAMMSSQLTSQGKFEEALETIGRGEKLFSGSSQLLSAHRNVYDSWAGSFARTKKWEQAVAVYEDALKQLPGDSHLTNNAIVVWNSLAKTHMDKKDWASAIEVYEKALKAFPSSNLIKNNLDYSKQQLK